MTDLINSFVNPEKVVTASAPLKSGGASDHDSGVDLQTHLSSGVATNDHDARGPYDHLNPHGATLVLHDVKLTTPLLTQTIYAFQSKLIMDDGKIRHEIYVPSDDGVDWCRGAGLIIPKVGQVWLQTVAPSTEEGCFATSDVCHGPQKDYYINLIGNLASGVKSEDIKVLPNGDYIINLDLRHSISPNKENSHYFRENPNDSTLFEIALTKGVIESHDKSSSKQLCSYVNPAYQNHQYLPFIDKAPCVSKYLRPGEIIDIKPGLISYYTPKAHFDETCAGPYCNYDLYGEYFVEGSKDIG